MNKSAGWNVLIVLHLKKGFHGMHRKAEGERVFELSDAV